VGLVNGARLPYDYLVVATGLRTRWDLIPGLEAALDDPKCPVVSIYDFHSCVKTSKFIGEFSAGTALFTQPPQPFKCAGAPQKIMWLAESQWRERGVRNAIEVLFATPIAAMFGIKRYSDVLENLRIQRSVKGLFNTQLVSVNGNDRTAVLKSGDNVVTQKFDLLHVSPPMSAPVCVSSSALADAAGFVDVDKNTMQHVRFPNVFAAGDVGSTPNSKTAVRHYCSGTPCLACGHGPLTVCQAAITRQVPVLVHNMCQHMQGRPLTAKYDGYASCPLLVGDGKAILAEFICGGVPQEVRSLICPRPMHIRHAHTMQTFARFVDQSQPWRVFFHLKKDFFPGADYSLASLPHLSQMSHILTAALRSVLALPLLRPMVRYVRIESPNISCVAPAPFAVNP